MFEEVKEMIDSTIYENGRGEVTAQNVNLAMHGMVDATEEGLAVVKDDVAALGKRVDEIAENGTGGGAGALRVWANNLFGLENTEEQIAENIATFNILLSGEHASVIACSEIEESVPEAEYVGKQFMTIPVRTIVVDAKSPDFNVQGVVLYYGENDTDGVGLLPDGSVEIIAEEKPAANGPLTFYVGYFTTLSAEERITAEQKEHNAAMFEIYKSSTYALGVFVDQSEMFTKSNGMSGRAIKTSVPYQAQYFPVETGAEAIMLKQNITDNNEIGIIIFPDGSVYSAHELE